MIDERRLPARAAFDTSVLIGARKEAEKDHAVCAALWTAMVSKGRYILIPAPVLAEFLRQPNTPLPPRIERVEIVAFDDLAAFQMAKFAEASSVLSLPGESKKVLKYDAMIIACAMRHQAECLVSCDERQRKLAERFGLKAAAPSDFLEAQQPLL